MPTVDSSLYVATLAAAANLGGRVRIAWDAFEVTTADLDAGDIMRLARLPAHARIYEIMTWHDDLDTNATETLTMDCGLYDTDGTVRDADGFASDVDWSDAFILSEGEHIRFQAGASGGYSNVSTIDSPLYTLVGDSSTTEAEYDLCLTVNTGAATPAAGTIAFVILYVTD